jgi:hypothetical protein
VEAAHSGTYQRLQEVIAEYGEANGLPDVKDAARRWYGQLYRPLVRRIRGLGLVRRFPGDRSADIFVRLADFRREQEAVGEAAHDWSDALDRFAAAHAAPGGGPGDAPPRRGLSLLGLRGSSPD